MQILKWVVFVLPILLITNLKAVDTPEPITSQTRDEFEPWFTGSLLSGAGRTVPIYHVNIEPYLFTTGYIGSYNNHWSSSSTPHAVTVSPLLFFAYGLTDNSDLVIFPQIFSNFHDHASDTRIGDFPLHMGFQTLIDRRGSWIPDLRIVVKSTFPTGHYEHLNPDKHGTDITGFGCYQGGVGFNFQKTFCSQIRLLRLRVNFDYLASSKVRVHGFNSYGGGYGTSGTVRPGYITNTIVALEYTFTQNWIGALDIKYTLTGSSRFSGKKGTLPSGATATVGFPSSQLISLAPAIEYAFNTHLGLIFGSWFTVAGKNSPRFVSGVLALNYFN